MAGGVFQTSLSGNEAIRVAQGAGGPENWLALNMLSGGSPMSIVSGSGAVTTAMTTQQSALMWSGTAPTTWTITLPPAPFDGRIVTIGTDTTLTTLVTVNAASGDTLNATFSTQTITAVTSVAFQYNASGAKWYRLR